MKRAAYQMGEDIANNTFDERLTTETYKELREFNLKKNFNGQNT